jgi:hypothetical protein
MLKLFNTLAWPTRTSVAANTRAPERPRAALADAVDELYDERPHYVAARWVPTPCGLLQTRDGRFY